MKLNTDFLKNILRAVLNTRDDEITCSECFDRIDTFIELELQGKSPAEAMPLVQDHLNRCGDCREEYEALLKALRQLDGGNEAGEG